MTGEPLDHEEVLEAGRAAAERMGHLLADVVGRL
jgi:purine-nucleoside phosphorylase